MRFFKHFSSPRRRYFDYASSTPLDPKMYRKFPRIPSAFKGVNPSALHTEGVALRGIVDAARDRVARVLEAHSDEIIFTSSATESDNLAITGTIERWVESGIAPESIVVFSSDLEHAAVQEVIERYVKRGLQHNIFPLEEGAVNPKHLIIPEHAKAVFVSLMYVSNEIGTVQPIAEMAKRIRKLRKDCPEREIIFHTDATQAPLYFSLRIPSLGVDLLTLGATKLYCQKGVGVLYKKRSMKLMPLMQGGGQEQGLRPGTEPAMLIHEFSHALSYAKELQKKETERIQELQKYIESLLKQHFPQIRITAETLVRTPHITHITIPHFDSELLVLELDARGIAVSSKSACKNEEGGESPLMEKLYGKGWGAVRLSFGRGTKKTDCDAALAALRSIFKKYQR